MNIKKMTEKQIAKKLKKRRSWEAKQQADLMNRPVPAKDQKDLKKHIVEKLKLMGFNDGYEIFQTNKVETRNELRIRDKTDKETGELVKNEKGEVEKEGYVEKVNYRKLMFKNFVRGLARKIKKMTRGEIDQFLHLDHVEYKQKLEKARKESMDRAVEAESKRIAEQAKVERDKLSRDSEPNTGEAPTLTTSVVS
jgi:hypothetical protein